MSELERATIRCRLISLRVFRAIAFGLLVFCSVPPPLLAQTAEEARLFNAAALGFEDGNYAWAERQFGEFIQKFPQSSRLPEAILFQARAALEQQRPKVAVDL